MATQTSETNENCHDKNHKKTIEMIYNRKNWPNDNENDLSTEQNASLDLDLTCWIILSAKFSMKSMKVKTTEGKKTPVVLVCKNMHLDFEDFSPPFQLI